jgi:hypothetical protein
MQSIKTISICYSFIWFKVVQDNML